MMMMMILLSHKDDNRLLPAWTRSRFYRPTCRATPRFANGSTAKPTWGPNSGTHTSSVCMTAASTKVSSGSRWTRRRHRCPTSARRPLSRRYARRRSRNDHDSGCRRSGLRPPGSATSRCQARQHHARRSRRRRRPTSRSDRLRYLTQLRRHQWTYYHQHDRRRRRATPAECAVIVRSAAVFGGYCSRSCVGAEGISLAPVMKATVSDIVTCLGSTTPMRCPRRWI
jgi:hypothetical protein